MTRRADVVRSNFAADPATARTRGGGCIILCSNWTFVRFGTGDNGGPTAVGPIQVVASGNYQRIFAAATLNGLHHDSGGEIIISIDTPALGEFTSITVPNDNGTACLTGVGDLPAGTHDIYLHIYGPSVGDAGGGGVADKILFQVIVGQQVDTPGCPGGGGGGSR